MADSETAFFDLGGPIALDALSYPPLPRATVKALGEAIRWGMEPTRLPLDHGQVVAKRARVAVARLVGLPAEHVTFATAEEREPYSPAPRTILHPPRLSPRLERRLSQLEAAGARLELLRSDEGDSDGRSLASILASREDAWVALDWIRPGDGVARDLDVIARESHASLRFSIEATPGLGRLPFPPVGEHELVLQAASGGSLLSPRGLELRATSRLPAAAPTDEISELLLAALTASCATIWEIGIDEIAAHVGSLQAALLPRLAEAGLTPVGALEPSAPRPTILLRRLDGGSVLPQLERLRLAGLACGYDGEHLRVALHIHNQRHHIEDFLCATKEVATTT